MSEISTKINENILQNGGLEHFRFFDNLAELPYIKAIYLFGSRATGKYMKNSDIDLAIVYKGDDIMHRRIVKAIAMEVADTYLDIDVVDYHDIGEELKKNIDLDKAVIYEEK